MTAVIRPALARLKASIMISSSMIDWLTGWQVGWTRKTSFSRTLSRMLDEDVLVGELEDLGLARLDAEVAGRSSGASSGFELPW